MGHSISFWKWIKAAKFKDRTKEAFSACYLMSFWGCWFDSVSTTRAVYSSQALKTCPLQLTCCHTEIRGRVADPWALLSLLDAQHEGSTVFGSDSRTPESVAELFSSTPPRTPKIPGCPTFYARPFSSVEELSARKLPLPHLRNPSSSPLTSRYLCFSFPYKLSSLLIPVMLIGADRHS